MAHCPTQLPLVSHMPEIMFVMCCRYFLLWYFSFQIFPTILNNYSLPPKKLFFLSTQNQCEVSAKFLMDTAKFLMDTAMDVEEHTGVYSKQYDTLSRISPCFLCPYLVTATTQNSGLKPSSCTCQDGHCAVH